VLTISAAGGPSGRINASGTMHRFSDEPLHDGTARVWDAATGNELASLRAENGLFLFAQFSPDGTHVLTADSGHQVRAWEWRARKVVLSWQVEHAMSAVAVSPDGSRLATGSSDGSIRIWAIASGLRQAVLNGHQGAVRAIAFSPDGRLLATASADQTACLWDAHTGAELAVLRGHERALQAVAFSQDGRCIVTAAADHTARVWDAASGKELFTLTGHQGPVASAVFSPDGTRALTASADGTARVWPLDPLPLALARKARDLTAKERERFAILPLEPK
jgi:WD40 repeat protein